MTKHILLHGADEYIGRLFVAEALAEWAQAGGTPALELWLSGHDAARVRVLAQQHGLQHCQLAVAASPASPVQLVQLAQQLADVDVLVNATSPFDETAVVLVQAAILAGCHSVDLNSEVDVFRKLAPMGAQALAAQVALVRSAGPGAAPTALMVSAALGLLQDSGYLQERCIGAVRIALQCVPDASRSSAASVWRALSRDVTVVRAVAPPQGGGGGGGAFRMRPDHVPIGVLERQFDFAVAGAPPATPRDTQIAAAANLVDTLVAGVEVERWVKVAGTVESYVGATTPARVAYPLGAAAASLFVPLAPKRLLGVLASYTLGALSDGPSVGPGLRHTIVIEIEDEERTCIADWRLSTPDFYLTGARCAVAVAATLARDGGAGLLSVAQVLDTNLATQPPSFGRALRECRLDKRVLA
jgi:hypothetical protein